VDHWAEWLLKRRFGGQEPPDAAAGLAHVRDRVLAGARLEEGSRLLDVGAGDGLIAFGALERGAGEVVFSDVSDDLLEHSRELATERGVLDRCAFVHAAADDLAPFEDGSFDAVTTRSVLIYVERKREALAEFHRVLKPGGRMSLFEPINRFGERFRAEESFMGYALGGLEEIAGKVLALYEKLQPDSDPMLDFDERDLLALADDAGFLPVELELHAQVVPRPPLSWDVFSSMAGNPKIPTLAEAMEEALSAAEREQLTRRLRPLVERGGGVGHSAIAYLTGTKPAE
jgi:arsenite methyltransferase